MKLTVASLMFLALAGCSQPVVNGFAGPDGKADPKRGERAATADSSTGIRRPLLRIRAIRGTSNAARRGLRDAIGAALRRRGIEVVNRGGPNVLDLSGSVAVLNEGNVTTYTYEWSLTDASGQPRARPIVGFERSAGGSSDMWGSVGGSALRKMSERIARKIALALGRAG